MPAMLDGPIAAYARERAQALAEDHARVRAAAAGSARVTVEPVLPPDVIGLWRPGGPSSGSNWGPSAAKLGRISNSSTCARRVSIAANDSPLWRWSSTMISSLTKPVAKRQ